MIEPEEKKKVQVAVLISWLIGCSVIFLVSSVTYRYFGLEGEGWFQFHGILVAIVIAHYTSRLFRFMSEAEDDIQE